MSAVSFQVEDWAKARPDMEWLWPMHWQEVANDRDKIPLDVWFEAYDQLADMGQLHIVTARVGALLVGYHWSIIRPHLHYHSCLTAFTDIYYLHPDHRKGMTGLALMRFFEQSVKAKGVRKIYTAHKEKLDKGIIFERLGYQKSEIVYTKYIGE